MQYYLVHNIILDKFVIKIYSLATSLDIGDLDQLTVELNQANYPRNIVEELQNIPGIVQIEVYNIQGQLLLNSFIPPDSQP